MSVGEFSAGLCSLGVGGVLRGLCLVEDKGEGNQRASLRAVIWTELGLFEGRTQGKEEPFPLLLLCCSMLG